jgi:hypothetical protein
MSHEFKDFKDLPSLPKQSPESIKSRERISLYHSPAKEKVVDGDVKWKPIDVVAARVVSKAPWWAEPPEPDPAFMTPEFREPPRLKAKKVLSEDGHLEEHIEMHSLAPIAVEQHEKTVKAGLKATEELTARANDLIDTVKHLSTQIGEPWTEFQQFIKKGISDTREQRIALGSETRLLMGSLKEVRQFFLEESYETEINRLHEFVDLCERLKVLQESGFLDAVADTILTLSK